MKRIHLGLVSSVALGLVTSHALAVKITATSAQPGRTEGQSVAVSAAINWEDPVGPVTNPLIRTTRTVTATVSPALITQSPMTISVNLALDSSTGLYTGAFPDLPFKNYTATITATKIVRSTAGAIVGSPLPAPVTTTASTTQQVQVGAPAGCFHFTGHSLQGFTVSGFFGNDTTQLVAPGFFNPQWSALSFGNVAASDGSFFLDLAGAQPPLANQVNGDYRFDISSPDLHGNGAWQGITGISFRYMTSNAAALKLHAVARVQLANGTLALFTQSNPDGTPLNSNAFGQNFETMVDQFSLPPGATVVGVDVRAFATPGTILPNLTVDSVCPRH